MTDRIVLPSLTLPWPLPPLWPNRRYHRQVVAAMRADQRHTAHALACEARWHLMSPPEGVLTLDIVFCPPARRRYDLDGVLAACKGSLDGMSDALGLDDSWFQPRLHRGEKMKGGGVIIHAQATGEGWRPVGAIAASIGREAASKRANAAGHNATPQS